WRVAIGDADLSESEFAELVARNERLVRFRGQWIALDPALLAQIRRAMAGIDSAQGLSFQDILQLHLLGNADEPEGDASGEQPEDA
ncbi:SNF2 helicase-associated domain-containing protein, partial [Paenibacillus sp. EKM208P]